MSETLVEAQGVTKIYGKEAAEVAALAGVSLRIQAGEFVAIMGPSGSGKTTFMNIIGCLDRPTGGTYKLQGHEVGSLSDDQLADLRNRYLGFVFQNFNLLPQYTAVQNVELPLLYAGVIDRHDIAMEALERVRIADRATHRPSELSGGQQQRVAIARALVTKPSLILADEPTGALDSRTGNEIMEVFTHLNEQGITLVTVTHDARVAQSARRLVKFLDGHIVQDGSFFDDEPEEDQLT